MNKNNKKFNKSRRSGRKNKRTRFRQRVPGVKFGLNFPDDVSVTQKYIERLIRAPGTVTDEYVFSGNGLYDPNITGIGDQPSSFDQLATLYSRYRVYHSSINVEFINNQTTGTGTYFCVFPSQISTGVTTIEDAISQRYAKHGFGGLAGGYPLTKLSASMSTGKIVGTTAFKYEDTYAALTNANPTHAWYWVINAYSASSDNVSYGMLVTVTYRSTWFDRIPLDLSLYQQRLIKHQDNLNKKLEIKEESKSSDIIDDPFMNGL